MRGPVECTCKYTGIATYIYTYTYKYTYTYTYTYAYTFTHNYTAGYEFCTGSHVSHIDLRTHGFPEEGVMGKENFYITTTIVCNTYLYQLHEILSVTTIGKMFTK